MMQSPLLCLVSHSCLEGKNWPPTQVTNASASEEVCAGWLCCWLGTCESCRPLGEPGQHSSRQEGLTYCTYGFLTPTFPHLLFSAFERGCHMPGPVTSRGSFVSVSYLPTEYEVQPNVGSRDSNLGPRVASAFTH